MREPGADARHLPFIDWMKAVGMGLVVYGHVAGGTAVALTPPFYIKQLGVVCFVFASGFTLARERRPSAVVVFNRFFEIALLTAIAAVVMSVVGLWTRGDPAESNYLPLVGLHFILNAFPANPTTWYVGTYLHLLIVWALVIRKIRVTPFVCAVTWVIEVVVRTASLVWVGPYFAYLQLFNWVGVLMLGTWFGRSERAKPPVLFGLVFLVAWPVLVGLAGWKPTESFFPFMELPGVSVPMAAVIVSVAVSIAYACYGLSAYALLGRLPDHAIGRFFARNSLIVFIAHMPVYYLLMDLFAPIPSYALRVTLEFVICFVGLSLCSEVVHRMIPMRALRDAIGRRALGASERDARTAR